MLLRQVADIADSQDPPTPMYLEALPHARPIYERHGFQGVDHERVKSIMIRQGPKVSTT